MATYNCITHPNYFGVWMPVWQCTTTFLLGWVWPREHSYQLKGSTCPNEVDPSDIGQGRHVLCNQSWLRNKDVSLLQLRGDGWMYRKRTCKFAILTRAHTKLLTISPSMLWLLNMCFWATSTVDLWPTAVATVVWWLKFMKLQVSFKSWLEQNQDMC